MMNSLNLIYMLDKLYNYDATTGHFTYKDGPLAGKWAGFTNKEGYRFLKVKGSVVKEHKASYVKYNQQLPQKCKRELITHKDGDRSNNNPLNLVVSTYSHLRLAEGPKGKSKYKGVISRDNRFRAKFKGTYLGSFVSSEAAAYTYNLAVMADDEAGDNAYLNDLSDYDLIKIVYEVTSNKRGALVSFDSLQTRLKDIVAPALEEMLHAN